MTSRAPLWVAIAIVLAGCAGTPIPPDEPTSSLPDGDAPTGTQTGTATATPSPTASPTPTPSPTLTPSPTPTASPTVAPAPPPPTPELTALKDGHVVRFTFQDAFEPTRAHWWFGDGTTSTELTPTHAYGRVGAFVATVEVWHGDTRFEASTPVTIDDVPLEIHPSISGDTVLWAFTWGHDGVATTWDFGDGTTSTLAAPSKTYTSAGPFEVVLRVQAGARSATQTYDLVLEDFPLRVTAVRDRTVVDLTASWGWPIETYAWDFGDGSTSTEAAPRHTFPDGGSRVITLTVTGAGRTRTTSQPVHVPTYLPQVVVVQDLDTVTLSFVWELQPQTWQWDLDDGSPPATDAEVTHTFTRLGTYDIKLTVTDGLVERTVVTPVSVLNKAAEIALQHFGLQVDVTAMWLDAADGPFTTRWDFGDGSPVVAGNPRHYRYADPGTYDITVTLNKGALQQTATLRHVAERLPEPEWGDPAEAPLRPGIRTYADGQCTSNFLFTFDHERYFIGSAGHCVSSEDATFLHGDCASMPDGVPLGTAVEFESWQDNSIVATGTLAYHAWSTMNAVGETSDDTCIGNDFALYEVAKKDWGLLHPAMLHFGGPTALGGQPAEGDAVYGYGASAARTIAGPYTHDTNMRTGQYIETANSGWTHTVQMTPTFHQGDSGSGLIDADGRVLGALSTGGAAAGTDGVYTPNNYVNIPKALAYMQAQVGWAPTLVTWDDFTADATPPVVEEIQGAPEDITTLAGTVLETLLCLLGTC